MGLDGFSMGNLGLHKEITSAQMANQAEQLAMKGLEFKIKDVDGLAKEKGVKRKEDEEESTENEFQDGFFSKEEENEDDSSSFDEKEFEKRDPREFSVRINNKTEMVELYNNKDKKIVEEISANDLMTLISNLDNASGILVNKKI